MNSGFRCFVLAIGAFTVGTDGFVIAGLLPNLAASYKVSVPIAGQLVTAYALSYALFSPFVAAFTCHLPKKNNLVAGLIIFAAANLMGGLCTDFALALILRGLAGLGAGIFTPNATAVAAEIVGPDRKNRAIATVMLGLSSATAFGSPLGVLLAPIFGWRAIFIFITALAMCTVILILRLLPAMTPSSIPSFVERIRPLRTQKIALTLLSTFLVLTGLYTTYTFSSLVFSTATAHRADRLAMLLSIWGIAALFGSVVGRLADRFGDRIVVNLALVCLFLNFFFLKATGSTLYGAGVGIMIWGICGWAFVIPQQHRLISVAPQIASILIGLHLMAVYFGTTFSAITGAMALHFMAPINLVLLSAAFVLCGLIVSEVANEIEKRQAKFPKPLALFLPQ